MNNVISGNAEVIVTRLDTMMGNPGGDHVYKVAHTAWISTITISSA